MGEGLANLNDNRKAECLAVPNDRGVALWYGWSMAKAKAPKRKPLHDWYLVEWLRYFGKIQADLERDLEWNKSKASLMCNQAQRYHRDDVNQVAEWLHLKPYELLMPPEEAMNMRQLRQTALKIAAENPPETPPPLSVGEGRIKVVNG